MNTYIILGMGIGLAVFYYLIKVLFKRDKASLGSVYNNSNPIINNSKVKIDVKGLLSKGKKIEAIKYVHENFNVGLKEAKDIVDFMESKSN